MKFFEHKMEKRPSASIEFKKFVDDQMTYLEFSSKTQKGLLFFLGASLIAEINDTPFQLGFDRSNESKFFEFLFEIVNLYSVSTGDFNDYDDLNDYVFADAIYNFSYVIHNEILKIDEDFDENLRKIQINDNALVVPNKTNLDEALIEQYHSEKFSLNTFMNLLTEFFERIGSHLEKKKYSNEKSYEAGFAFYNMQIQTDVEGTFFLYNVIRLMMPAAYKIFWNYPVFFKLFKKELYANHVFSSILQFHYGSLSSLMENGPVKFIHEFHQMLFYEPNTTELRSLWDFKNVDQIEILYTIFFQTIDMRRLLGDNKEMFIESKEIRNKELIGVSIKRIDFLKEILELVSEKYEINASAKGWNNFGDYLQALAVFYYECALHISLPKEIVD